MEVSQAHPAKGRQVAAMVRQRVETGGERLWRLDDFGDLPFPAVAQALSRLSRDGTLQRLSKGTYFRSRKTAFGASRPNPVTIQQRAAKRKPVFPSGVAAANLLGLTTQNPARTELSTTAQSLPRKLIGEDTVLHTRRPEAWSRLSQLEAALLDFLRQGGKTSELTPEQTAKRLLALLKEPGRFQNLMQAADTEPPRVRAMLGALAERSGQGAQALEHLRRSLNPLSRFDFGILSDLPNARAWLAKERG